MSRFSLVSDARGLALVDEFSHQHPLHIDFNSPSFSYRLRRGGGKKELLARAVDAKPGLRVIDCTAGLGRDSFLLAHLGCNVLMLERSRVMYLLLADALARASDRQIDTCSRLELLCEDATRYLGKLDVPPDVILLDPMFPSSKKAASVKGEMQFLQRFIGEQADIDMLLQTSRNTGCRRVVLKRPARAPDAGASFTLSGKSSRFDVFVQ